MHILATSTAFPPHYYTQREFLDALLPYWGQDPKVASIVERLHLRTGVDGRYFSRRLDEYLALDTWGKTNDAWIEKALDLGERAIDCAVQQAGLRADQLRAISSSWFRGGRRLSPQVPPVDVTLIGIENHVAAVGRKRCILDFKIPEVMSRAAPPWSGRE